MNKTITDFAVNFLKNHWNEIQRVDAKYLAKDKLSQIKKVKEDYTEACWIISEIMSWGCVKDYLAEITVSAYNDEKLYIKIKNKYFMYNSTTCLFEEVMPKYKKVLYFRD